MIIQLYMHINPSMHHKPAHGLSIIYSHSSVAGCVEIMNISFFFITRTVIIIMYFLLSAKA